MNDQQPALRPASLARALKKGFREAYDHLGFVALVSFATFAGSAALVALGLWIIAASRPGMFVGAALLLPGAFFYYVCEVGIIYYAHKCVYHEHPSLADTWTGIRTLFVPALWLFLIDAAVMAILLGDAMFFLSLKLGALSIALGVACLYAAAIWLMTAVYHLALLPAQLDLPSGPRPFVVIRKSFLLALGSPGFTVGLFLAIITLAVLCALPALVGTALFFTGASAFILTQALRELFVRYGVVEEEPEVADDKGWPG